MDSTSTSKIWELEKEDKQDEAFELLERLSSNKDPLALIELGTRYICCEGSKPPVKIIPKDEEKGNQLMNEGRAELEKLASSGDGEAMRMLSYTYLNLLGIFDKDIPLAEEWLLKSFDSGCYFSANDLHTFYMHSDKEKAKYYYDQASHHKCRVVYNKDYES